MPQGRGPKEGRREENVGRRRETLGTGAVVYAKVCQRLGASWGPRDQGRRSRGREAEQVLMQGNALLEAPFPDRREGGGTMNE